MGCAAGAAAPPASGDPWITTGPARGPRLTQRLPQRTDAPGLDGRVPMRYREHLPMDRSGLMRRAVGDAGAVFGVLVFYALLTSHHVYAQSATATSSRSTQTAQASPTPTDNGVPNWATALESGVLGL